ncbi:MAG: hypothetical protein ACFE8L_01245, partial [Candidatus Hodarchaeota archaeon]
MKQDKARNFGQIIKKSTKINRRLFPIIFIGGIIIGISIWAFFMAQIPPMILGISYSLNIDGGVDGDDGALGMVMDEEGCLYATGYITVNGQGKDIWLAKFDPTLIMLKNTTINGLANDDDIGYVLVLDEIGFLYLIGYISQIGEDHNIFLAKFNRTDLLMVKNITINGPINGTDEGYGMVYNNNDNNLYIAGTVQEPDEGYNIYLGKYDTDLNIIQNTTLNGPINGTDKGRFLTFDDMGNLYVSGSKSQAGTGYDLWLGKFNTNLTLLDEIIIASPTTGEDKGYGLVYDGLSTIYITGTLSHDTQGYNIFLAKYNTSLNQLHNITLNGPANGEDIAYSISFFKSQLVQTGVYTETYGGANIWVAVFNKDLKLILHDTVDSASHGYDTGYGVISTYGIYVSGFIDHPSEGTNIWIAQYSIAYI